MSKKAERDERRSSLRGHQRLEATCSAEADDHGEAVLPRRHAPEAEPERRHAPAAGCAQKRPRNETQRQPERHFQRHLACRSQPAAALTATNGTAQTPKTIPRFVAAEPLTQALQAAAIMPGMAIESSRQCSLEACCSPPGACF